MNFFYSYLINKNITTEFHGGDKVFELKPPCNLQLHSSVSSVVFYSFLAAYNTGSCCSWKKY